MRPRPALGGEIVLDSLLAFGELGTVDEPLDARLAVRIDDAKLIVFAR